LRCKDTASVIVRNYSQTQLGLILIKGQILKLQTVNSGLFNRGITQRMLLLCTLALIAKQMFEKVDLLGFP
jgi:hypothetical protein